MPIAKNHPLRPPLPSFGQFFSHREQAITDIGYDDFTVVKPLLIPRFQAHSTLHFVLSGEGRLELGERAYSLSAGQVFFVPPGLAFRYYPVVGKEWSYIWFGVSEAGEYWLRECGFSVEAPVRAVQREEETAEHLLRMIADCRGDTVADYLRAKAVFFSLLADLVPPRAARTTLPPPHSAVTDAIISLIETNYKNPALTVEMLCRIVHVSHPYLCKLFHRETGKTVKGAIIERRMTEARRLLREGERVTDVAEAVGYGDSIHFSKEFHRRHNLSPMAYRNKHVQAAARDET